MDSEMEMVRKIILEQEALFRRQVQELHRVYRIQKLLAQELKMSHQFSGKAVKIEASPAPAPQAPSRRRTFDLELPAEEYMDVEEPVSSRACDLVSRLNAPKAPEEIIPRSSSSSRDGESDLLQMLKRAKSSPPSDECFAAAGAAHPQHQQGFLNGFWRYGTGVSPAPFSSEKPRNGFHHLGGPVLGEDKGSRDVLSLNSKPENQLVFLDPGAAIARQQQHSNGVESFNPFFSEHHQHHQREENGKFAGGLGLRLQNQISYSGQGILIPSSSPAAAPNNNMGGVFRRDSFLEPGLNLFWKSNAGAFFPQQQQQQQQLQQHQPQYQQMAVFQQQSSSGAPQSWPGSFHPPMLSSGSGGSSIPAVLPAAGILGKEENGSAAPGWLKSSNGGAAGSPGFHYSASTPPKPPFKKPPKLILDGATMELKLAPLDSALLHLAPAAAPVPVIVGGGGLSGDETEKGAEIPRLQQQQGFVGTDLNAPPSSENQIARAPEELQEEQIITSSRQEEKLVSGAAPAEEPSRQEESSRSEDEVKLENHREMDLEEVVVEKKSRSSSELLRGEETSSSSKKRRLKVLSSGGDLLATRETTRKSGGDEAEGGGTSKRRKSGGASVVVLHSSASSSRGKSKPPPPPPAPSKSCFADENLESLDDGANLAAEILVSLAPGAAKKHSQHQLPLPPEKNGAARPHHKSKRRLIDALSTNPGGGGSCTGAPLAAVAAAEVEVAVKESKKMKKKRKKSGKKQLHDSSAEEQQPPQQQQQQVVHQKVSVKSVKVALTQCEYPEIAEKSSSKHQQQQHRKHLQQKDQQQQQPLSKKAAPISKKSSSSSGTPGARDHGGKVTTTTTTTVNLVISKPSRDRDRDQGKAQNHLHHHDKKNNNLEQQESLDRLSQQQSGENSSEINGKESDEVEDSSWSRRSWGASARRKRMRRCKRSGL